MYPSVSDEIRAALSTFFDRATGLILYTVLFFTGMAIVIKSLQVIGVL